LDPKTTSTHVSSEDEIDHVSKKYPHDAKGWVEGVATCASNDSHVSDININFALVQEVDVKASYIVNAFDLPVQQVSAIHDLAYVVGEHHGAYVSKVKKWESNKIAHH
jgi:hypothetical protein